MRKALTAFGLVAIVLVAAACGPEPSPIAGHVNFGACVGSDGNCGGADCCAGSTEIMITDEYAGRIDCKLFNGSTEGQIRVDIEMYSESQQDGFTADNLVFDNNPSSPVGVRACDGFEVRVGGNNFPSTECGNIEPRAEFPPGGGCEVQMHLDAENVIVGRFRCKEIQLPAQNLYFSSLFESETGWGVGYGEFRFENCIDRR